MIPNSLPLNVLGFLIVLAYFITASPTFSNPLEASSDEWTLSTNKINATSFADEPYVANGYIGARLPVEGVGLRVHPAINYAAENGTQGWPLFTLRQTASIVAGFYDHQSETKGTNFVST